MGRSIQHGFLQRGCGFAALAALALAPLSAAADAGTPPTAPSAQTRPATAGTADATTGWTGSHMQSSYGRKVEKVTRPPIQGASAYQALAAGTAETRTEVPETLDTATQRNWEQGPLTTRPPEERAATRAVGPEAGRSFLGSTLRRNSVHRR